LSVRGEWGCANKSENGGATASAVAVCANRARRKEQVDAIEDPDTRGVAISVAVPEERAIPARR